MYPSERPVSPKPTLPDRWLERQVATTYYRRLPRHERLLFGGAALEIHDLPVAALYCGKLAG